MNNSRRALINELVDIAVAQGLPNYKVGNRISAFTNGLEERREAVDYLTLIRTRQGHDISSFSGVADLPDHIGPRRHLASRQAAGQDRPSASTARWRNRASGGEAEPTFNLALTPEGKTVAVPRPHPGQGLVLTPEGETVAVRRPVRSERRRTPSEPISTRDDPTWREIVAAYRRCGARPDLRSVAKKMGISEQSVRNRLRPLGIADWRHVHAHVAVENDR